MMAPIHARKAVRIAERWMRARMADNFIEPQAMILSCAKVVERDVKTGEVVTGRRPMISVYMRDIVQNTDFRYAVRIPRPLDFDDARAIVLAVFNAITAKAKSEAKAAAERN